jgi:hypothetical protein
MSDDERGRGPPDTARPLDHRRTTGRQQPAPQARPPSHGSMQRVVEVHVPAAIPPRDGDDAFRRRVLSEVDERMRGMAEGLAHHVRQIVHAELQPYLDKLSLIDEMKRLLEEDREERIRYRAAREERERIERQQRKTTEANRKYLLALLGLLAGLIGAAIAAHAR